MGSSGPSVPSGRFWAAFRLERFELAVVVALAGSSAIGEAVYRQFSADAFLGAPRWVDLGAYLSLLIVSSFGLDSLRRRSTRAERERDLVRAELQRRLAEHSEQLERIEGQLRRSERLASLGTLTAGIVHEINNPVGSILLAGHYAGTCKDEPEALARSTTSRNSPADAGRSRKTF